MRNSILLATVPFVLLAGCNQQAPVDSDAILSQLDQIEQDQAGNINKGDAEASSSVYAGDAVFTAPGTPLVGTPEAIRAGFDAMAKDKNTDMELGPSKGWVGKGGDLAVTVANFKYTFTDPGSGKAKTVDGVNQTAWKKQDDGSWKIVADFNTETTPAT
jgi:uncharacterized protein (TIGR02246 family)